MARERMVTRTVKSTKVNVLCLDIERGEAENVSAVISGVFDNSEKLLKACKKVIETETLKAVSVVEKEEVEQLYGMPEQEFISLATVLPPREAKAEAEKEEEE